MTFLRVALAQVNVTVGDLPGNRRLLAEQVKQAREAGADVVVLPELAMTGYPPEDLLLKPSFLRAARGEVDALARETRGLVALVGAPEVDGDLYNAAYVLEDGRVVATTRKQYLPNYGVFDESRYFQSGRGVQTLDLAGARLGVSICEDIWYPDGPPEAQVSVGGAEALLNLSSSPYHARKGEARQRMLATRAADHVAYVAYCNLVGGQDELVFDGQSVVFDPRGNLVARAPQFEEDLLVADLDLGLVLRCRLGEPRLRRLRPAEERVERVPLAHAPGDRAVPSRPPRQAAPLEPVAEVYEALVLGTRDYVRKNGFRRVVLGLSGGVDSSLVAAIAADAVGPRNVTGVTMPTRYSSGGSVTDSEALAANLGIELLTIPIDGVFQSFLDALAPVFSGKASDLTEENLQPRVRGTMLMALSNKFGWLVLTTGNKSEVSVGYSTLYGDTAGGFAVIRDVPKTLVYALCRHRNEKAGKDLVPRSVLEKPPSAELRPGQMDADSLPPYDALDAILQSYVEELRTPAEIAAAGFDEALVADVVRKVDRNEYKRRQSPPGVKITPRAFGRDWRLPITNRHREP